MVPHVAARLATTRVVVPLLAVLLTGCTTVASTIARIAYTSSTEERTFVEQATDTQTAVEIRDRLYNADAESILFLDVFCHLGRVVIAGAVPPESPLREQAATIARSVEGVRLVETYYVPSQPSKISDLVIGAQLKAKIVGDGDLKASQVDFTVLDGHVVLVGVVNRQAKIDRIVAHARAVDGVTAVRSFMQIRPPQN